jgi:uncharacterized protein YabE (DUF348 family)
MIRILLIFLAAALALAGIFLVSQGIDKTITLEINGQSGEIETSVWTVTGLLTEQEISLNEADAIDPPLSTWLTGGETISIEKAAWVTIVADGDATSVFTRQRSPKSILSEAGIKLSTGVQILLDGKPVSINSSLSPGSNHSLQVQRAQNVEFQVADQPESILTTSTTLGDALWENGINLSIADRLSPTANTSLDKPLSVKFKNSQDVSVRYAAGTIKARTAAETVGEALSEMGIPLQGLDYSRPDANSEIPQDGIIQIIRVKENLLLENEPIPYDKETQPVADLEIDNRKVVQSGIYGLNTKRVRVRYEDDLEIFRQVEAEYTSQKPQSEIIGYGTQIIPHTINTPDGSMKYWRAISLYAISYNVTSNGGYGTATGIPLAKGVAAIDPRFIPYGTRMYVPGYGEALAADTGGGIKGRMIDLGYLDEDYVSWHEWVTVYFLWPPPENVVWVIP